MQPAGSPPWRVIETPPAQGGATPVASREGVPAETVRAPAGISLDLRVLATVGATIACAVIAFVLAFGSGSGATIVDGGAPLDADPSGSATAIGPLDTEVVVEIVGAVTRPGVYRLPGGSRVVDLVEAAGGYGPRVDTARAERDLNLAATLSDGDQVRVPSRDDDVAVAGSAAPGEGGGGATGPVSLNRATSAELEALPGIGPATAAKIIAAREEAPFVAVEDLRTRGILGEKTFEKLRDLVTP